MMTGNVVDFCKPNPDKSCQKHSLTFPVYSERVEMASMTRASEIAPNVYLGPTPDPMVIQQCHSDPQFDVFIEASDLSQIPDLQTLQGLRSALDSPDLPTVQFEVPSSGSIMPPTWSQTEVDGLLRVCRWIWEVSRGQESNHKDSEFTATASLDKSTPVDVDGDTEMLSTLPNVFQSPPRKILIHCADGYTESSLIGLTYYMYAHCLPVGEAWIKLHREERRNFFAYSTDVALLSSIQARILSESPARIPDPVSPLQSVVPSEPEWLSKMDGSLPSRILPYMYLGNLSHANNPALLERLGIQRVVSVGEKVNWAGVMDSTDGFELVTVKNVQDNGVDALSTEFERCLEVIGT
jgi:dual specificity MAP kinase phosphatase